MMSGNEVLLMKEIVKDFPGVRALNHVNFSLEQGEVHGLVGENGAGKSTLIKILAGVYERDAGEVIIQGKPCGNLNPHLVESFGIQFIHQETHLVPGFTVAQSLFLGQERVLSTLFPLTDNRGMSAHAEEFIEKTLNVHLDPNALVRDLKVADRQIIQIARALMANPTILAFDEPTAPLASREIEQLFTIIRNLQEQGITMIYISHYLQEIMEICNRVSVLRNGENVGTLETSTTSENEIVTLMVGQEQEKMFPEKKKDHQPGKVVLRTTGLSRRDTFSDVNFELREGEILGVTGIIGSGHHELVEVLYGLRRFHAGTIEVHGKPVRNWTATQSVNSGLGLVPRDRRDDGLVLDMSVNDNVNLASYNDVSMLGFLRHLRAGNRTRKMVDDLAIRTPNIRQEAKYLSGGNQQKVVIARWLTVGSSIYILNDPTVGVDVGAKAEIYQLVRDLADQGTGVLLVSDDITEILGVSDRILVMFRGKIIKELQNEGVTFDVVLQWTTGSRNE
jgi:ribose transport system ATP-binding protein